MAKGWAVLALLAFACFAQRALAQGDDAEVDLTAVVNGNSMRNWEDLTGGDAAPAAPDLDAAPAAAAPADDGGSARATLTEPAPAGSADEGGAPWERRVEEQREKYRILQPAAGGGGGGGGGAAGAPRPPSAAQSFKRFATAASEALRKPRFESEQELAKKVRSPPARCAGRACRRARAQFYFFLRRVSEYVPDRLFARADAPIALENNFASWQASVQM